MTILSKRSRERDPSSSGSRNRNRNASHQIIPSSSTRRQVHCLPRDIFFKILGMLEPREVARLMTVSKAWKVILSDNSLWLSFLKNQPGGDTILFGETKLRYSPICSYPLKSLAFKEIYGERTQAPGAIIIDAGTGFCKVGWSHYDTPSLRFYTQLEFGLTIGSSSLSDKLASFCRMVFQRLHMKPWTLPVIVTTPIGFQLGVEASSEQLRDALFATLIRMKVPSVCTISQEALAIFTSQRTTGIVVNIGHQKTSVFSVVRGRTKHKEICIEIGGLDLTRYLWKKLAQRDINVPSLDIVQSLKEKLCFVALDYETELQKDSTASCQVGHGGVYTLNNERFEVGEVLFKPELFLKGRDLMGLPEAVALCIERGTKRRRESNRHKNILLVGGTARLPGLAARLEMELHNVLPPAISTGLHVRASEYGADAAWHGARIVGNLSTFKKNWCF